MKNYQFIKETVSTNTLLWEMLRKESLPEGFVVQTDFQTAGKGQMGNSWESESGENLLFSMLLYPQRVPTDQLFLISQIVSIGLKKALDNYVDGITVKWPNDIYWNDKKLAGILIENSFQANKVKTVVGIGLNVNQRKFVSNAPNPISLRQIVGKSINRAKLLEEICGNILDVYFKMSVAAIQDAYAQATGLSDRGIYQANFYVVKHTAMPASLVELAFLSNPNEEKLLLNSQFQQKMAEGIFHGIDSFFTQAAARGGDRS